MNKQGLNQGFNPRLKPEVNQDETKIKPGLPGLKTKPMTITVLTMNQLALNPRTKSNTNHNKQDQEENRINPGLTKKINKAPKITGLNKD